MPVGRRIHYILSSCLIRVPVLRSCFVNAVGTELPVLSIALDALHLLREELAHLFGCVCVEPVSVGGFATEPTCLEQLLETRTGRSPNGSLLMVSRGA